MPHVNYVACFTACILLTSGGCVHTNTYVLFTNTDIWHRFDKQFLVFHNVSRVQCIGHCDRQDKCLSVNYNKNIHECELNEYAPLNTSTNYVTETGWRAYYSNEVVANGDLTVGATAWQSSTVAWGSADLALDGNTEGQFFGRSCSHTEADGSAYWAMEFDSEGPVGRIVLYFRTDCCRERNTKLSFLVSGTRNDVDNDVGTMCATYNGPPIDLQEPATITCDTFSYGKYLKVIQGTNDPLSVCEIYVYPE